MSPTIPGLLVLNGLRLKGFAEADAVAGFVGLRPQVVEEYLRAAAHEGFVRHRDGQPSGWSLTADGRAENERLLAMELDAADVRGAVAAAYERFLALNGSMLQICTRWQVVDIDAQVINDHSDPAYDESVIGQLIEMDAHVQPICAELGEWLERFGNYGPRFVFALDKLRGGDIDWFTKPTLESYHTVWFELHEDLLATLGIDRASEKTPH